MNKKTKRISALLIAALFAATNTVTAASNITGIQANNGIYNITPKTINRETKTGFRTYQDFNLDKGDVANLNYKYNNTDLKAFVNLVDNKININGIVNSVKDNKFYNGEAYFISPKGMVIGSSGVMNVGSLTVETPTQETYNKFKANPETAEKIFTINNDSSVVIDGKVLAINDIKLNSGTISIGKTGYIANGNVNANIINSDKDIFDTIVNTKQVNNGDILLLSNVGTSINGKVENNNKGQIQIINSGSHGIWLNGDITNNSGNIQINNRAGRIEVNGNVKSSGDILLENNGKYGILINSKGKIDSDSNIYLTNTGDTGMNIKGQVNAKDDITLVANNSDITIGDNTANDNYVSACKDINIHVDGGSLINYGTDKTLVKAGKDLNVEAHNGSIGRSARSIYNSVTNSWANKGSWSYKDSINGDIKGKVSLTTANDNKNKQNLSINYRAKGSDMHIDAIKADGDVTLIADDNNKTINIINNATDKSNSPNIESDKITLISNGSIGTKDNKITFNQKRGSMDVLANGDINIKALASSRNLSSDVNNLISRTGSIDAEFGGNTHIKNTTAEKN